MDHRARPSVNLRQGTNEDPSQLMPALYSAPPLASRPPSSSTWNPGQQMPSQHMPQGYGIGAGHPPGGGMTGTMPGHYPHMASRGGFGGGGGGMGGGGVSYASAQSSPWGSTMTTSTDGGGGGSGGVSSMRSMQTGRSSFEMQGLMGAISGVEDERSSGMTDRGQKAGGGGRGPDSSTNMSVGGHSNASDHHHTSTSKANPNFSNTLIDRSSAGGGNGNGYQSSGGGGGGTGAGGTNLSNGSGGSNASMRSSAAASASAGGSECRRFTAVQVYKATEGFSDSNILGRGAFGSVFRGKLLGCNVAIKRLEGGGWQGPNEYRTEVEVLSRMRHPHIVLLMGHCPEEHCLVYEFLPGGSLQDFLNPAKKTRALTWADRVRILSEISSALFYLHYHEPPIAHRDLKPDNVLLDHNLTSKLGDVGLARLVHEEQNVTARVRGTAGYIDPEEVVTCEISVLSDVYAFGLIALQLLLGEPNVKAIQRVLNEVGNLPGAGGGRGLSRAADLIMSRLDQSCGEWNADVARQIAVIALRCADQKRMRRPDLAEEIQPVLQRVAEEALRELEKKRHGMEAQLICPLSNVRMSDPVVAADGYTYERSAIEQWLEMNDASPCTGELMPHKFLTPNNGLRQLLSG